MDANLVQGIQLVYAERTDPVVFALTGRTGSGCTTAAGILGREFSDIPLAEGAPSEIETRKLQIAVDFAAKHWRPFSAVTVSSVIFSFLLDEDPDALTAFLAAQKLQRAGQAEIERNLQRLAGDPRRAAFRSACDGLASAAEKTEAWAFYSQEVHALAQQSKKVLGGDYPGLFQKLGDNIRFSGSPVNTSIRHQRLFQLMERVHMLVACCIEAQRSTADRARVVIDAIRNPLELIYLRRRIPGLFIMAVTVDDDVRRRRLYEIGLSKKEVDDLDSKEYPESKHLESYSSFVSQNLKDCIQKSDIFIANPGPPGTLLPNVKHMNLQLVRYVALALRPGLITPTREERCMQIAFVSKLNSGCISRQVGAVVADQGHAVRAIGWNDTPKGQTSCLLRDTADLLSGRDDVSFSDFERSDPKLRSHLEAKFADRERLRTEMGLPCPFCFKDAYNAIKKDRNQVHTRSLHAEENAFLQVAKHGGVGMEGGVLYTTASPCELCSKKAFQIGIKEIVFVDPYPGISSQHILKSGSESSQPRLRLFSGAIGHAYHHLYDSLLPVKDEYRALGFG